MGAFANTFNPRLIVIGGGVARLGDLLIAPALKAMPSYCFVDMRQDLKVTYSALGGDTGLYGAAALAFLETPSGSRA
jgi:glucokinase